MQVEYADLVHVYGKSYQPKSGLEEGENPSWLRELGK